MKYLVGKIIFALTLLCILAGVLCACGSTLAAPQNLAFSSGVLTWDAVVGADRYEVEMDGEQVAVVDETRYALSAVSSATFRVRALSDNKRVTASPYSSPLRYTATAIPSKTALPTPSIVDVNGQGLLSWSGVVNAVGYRIWCNNSVAYTVKESPFTLSFTGSGSAKIQVQAIGGDTYADSARSVSYTVTYEDGKIVSPRLRTVSLSFDSAEADLVWRVVPNAVSYAVHINQRVVNVVADQSNTFSDKGNVYCRYKPAFDANQTAIYVVAIANPALYRDSLESNVLSFPIQADEPPVNLRCEAQDEDIYLVWDAVEHCLAYEVKVEQNGVLVSLSETPNARYRLQTADGVYQVSVRALGNGMMYCDTEFSEQYELTLIDGGLPMVRLSVPSDVYVADGTLYFPEVLGASAYQISITSKHNGVDRESLTVQTATSYAIPSALAEEVIYFAVRAVGEGQYATSDWSKSVCYLPATKVGNDLYYLFSTLASPSGYVQNGILYWSVVNGAVGYRLCINDEEIDCTDTQYDLSGRSGRITYRLRALSDSEWVLSSPYTAESAIALPVRLSAPQGVTLTGDRLSWQSVRGAASYRIDIGGVTHEVTNANVDLGKIIQTDGTFSIRVAAVASSAWQADSLYSRSVTYVASQKFGTDTKPYPIASAEDWALLKQYSTSTFQLVADIDLGEVAELYGNDTSFCGKLLGNGHRLYNITLLSRGGLFGILNNAAIRDIQIEVKQTKATADADAKGVYVLAAHAYMSTFDQVTLVAAATSNGVLASVGISTDCTYTQCDMRLAYVAKDSVGGVVYRSNGDMFDGVQIAGSLSGQTDVGAVVAVANGSTFSDVTVGAQQAVLLTGAKGNIGCVGSGTLAEVVLSADLSVTAGGVCYVGGLGGYISAESMQGNVRLAVTADAEVIFTGGLVGSGAVAYADASVLLSFAGSATNSAYVGGVCGFANGNTACVDTFPVQMTVDLSAPSGSVCGVAAVGYCLFANRPIGTITVDENILVCLYSREDEDVPPYEDWVVSRRTN